MKRLLIVALLALFAPTVRPALAQDLLITNVRIITGTGQVIEQGSIAVRGGRITSVGAGAAAAPPGARTIDARGLTAMPGYIDGHRHIVNGNAQQYMATRAAQNMQEFLEAGYTTLLSGGGNAQSNLALSKAIESGQIKGPRVLAASSLSLMTTPDEARAEVRRLAGIGVKWIGEINVNSFDPDPKQMEVLKAAIDEAKKIGSYVVVHAASVKAMHAAIDAGTLRLVHTPHFGWMTDADAKRVADAGIFNLSTVAFGTPVFNVFNQDNVPTFRDGSAWPDKILDGEGRGREAGYKAVNARTLFDNGVVYGYGTDTGYLPIKGLEQELKTLFLMFSMKDIVKVMGPGSAAFVDMSKDIGTLETGKLADIVLLGGNPMDGFWHMLNVKTTIKGGVVVMEKK